MELISLEKDLQTPKLTLDEFGAVTIRVLQYMPIVISERKIKNNYIIFSSVIAGTTKYIRPINKTLFLENEDDFKKGFRDLIMIIRKIRKKIHVTNVEKRIIDRTVYTIQQSIGAGLDLLVNPNSARKHVGNRFEELIKVIFTEIGISNKKLVLQIPYDADEGGKTYKCENDLILSPYDKVKSSTEFLNENEIVVSVKTTSKDRMGKMFIDKILLQRFVDHPQKVIGIFLNDVQRKGNDNISFTLVSGLFMVYSNFLTKLEGVYYIDPPPNALKMPYSNYMKRFSDLITEEITLLLSS